MSIRYASGIKAGEGGCPPPSIPPGGVATKKNVGVKMERNTKIQIRMSEAEKSDLEKKAQASGLTNSDFIRQAIGRVRAWTPEHRKIQQEKIRQLAKIGNNLNQIARWCNTYKTDADSVQVLQALISIEHELKKVIG